LLIILTSIFLSYLIGSIPTSYIFAKLIKGIDIRDHGSGNVGATNLMRTAGKVPGVIALILDALKGVLAVTVIANIFYFQNSIISEPCFRVILGIFAVGGHIWTVFLKFKGGKGVATALGVFIGLAPLVTLISLGIWLIFVVLFKYVSLGSIAMCLSMPVLMYLYGTHIEYIILSITLCIFICYKHKTNISRLIKRQEYKIGQRVEK